MLVDVILFPIIYQRKSIDDVNEHLECLAKIKRLIPCYKAHQILGAIAGYEYCTINFTFGYCH